MKTAYYLGFKEKITNQFFLEQLQNKLSVTFSDLKFWKLRPSKPDADSAWEIATPHYSDAIWRIGTNAPGPVEQYKMRTSIHVFDVRVMKTGSKYHFSVPGDYWRVYALRRVLDSMAIDLGASIVELGMNSAYTKEIEPQTYKSYLDFLKQAAPNKLKTVRGFYLQEIKKLPQEIIDAEAGLKNFL